MSPAPALHPRLAPATANRADLIVINGNVLTMDPEHPVAQAIAIGQGRIMAVGSNQDAASWAGEEVPTLDLRGRTALPGFHDSHNHALFTGQNLGAVDLSGCRTIDEVLGAMAGRAGTTPAGKWIISSSRWHESQLAENRFPRLGELDRAVPDHPAMIRRGGHNIVVNSLALKLAGVAADTANPPGGTYVRDLQTGELTGHLIDAAMAPVNAAVPAPTDEELRQALRSVQRVYNQAGITSVIDPGLGPRELAAYKALRDAGELTLRANVMRRLQPGLDAASLQKAIGDLEDEAFQIDADDLWVRTVAIKLGIDGGVEAGYYRRPYDHPDDPLHPYGLPLISQDNFVAVCLAAARRGWQVGTHCVGDAAIDFVLAGYDAVNRESSILGRRWTLIHMMNARADHWEIANRLQAIVTAQQPLLFTLADGFRHYVGPERTANIEPLKMYLSSSGQPVGGGSDSPVTPFEPLLGIWSSVTRVTDQAGVQGAEWAVAVDDALQMYTRGSAWSAFEENVKGSIEPGKLADLVVLDRDPRSAEPDEIRSIQVMTTIVGGKAVFSRDDGSGGERPSAVIRPVATGSADECIAHG